MRKMTLGQIVVCAMVALLILVPFWYPLLVGVWWLIVLAWSLAWGLVKIVFAVLFWLLLQVVSSMISAVAVVLVIGGVACFAYYKLRAAPTRAQ